MNVRAHKVARDLLGNRARTILVVAAIAVGLAGLSTTLRARAIFTSNVAQELSAANPSNASVLTAGAGDAAVIAVAQRPDVDSAVGRLVVFGRIAVGSELRPMRLVILDNLAQSPIDRLRPEAGAWPPPADSIAFERSSLETAQLDIGDTATFKDPSGASHQLSVAASVHDVSVVSGRLVDQVVYAYMSTATWQHLGLPSGYNEIGFTIAGDATDTAGVREVADRITADLSAAGVPVTGVRIPTPGKHVLDSVISSLLLILGALGALSLVLSGFLVFNTVAATLARQGPQIGVMKAVGASRGEVLTLYLATIGIYSVLALMVALPIGAIAARILTNQLGSLLNIDIVDYGAPAWVWVVELAIGLLVPAVAALAPILSSTRATVAEAIRGAKAATAFGGGRIDSLLARLGGLPMSLRYGTRNTFRRLGRLALTVVALSLGGAILVTVLTLRSSLLTTVDSIAAYWQQDVTIDLQQASPLAALENVLGTTEGVAAFEGWLVVPASMVGPDGAETGEQVYVFGVPPASRFIEATLTAGKWLRSGDERNAVINVDVAAGGGRPAPGEALELRIGGHNSIWSVTGVATTQLVAPGEPRPSAPIVYVSYADLDRALGGTGSANRLVVAAAMHDAGAQSALAEAAEAELLAAGVEVRSVETRARTRAQVERLTAPILVLLSAMAGLFAVVGGLGLLGTMSLNVLERTAEIGIVRAVGATGRTVLSIVFVESLTVAALSWVIGSILAIPMGWTMARAVGVSFIRVPLDFRFAPMGVAIWLLMATGLAAISGWVPARNAARISVRDAIAYE